MRRKTGATQIRRWAAGLLAGLALLTGTAGASGSVVINGTEVDVQAKLYHNTTYVSIRTVSKALYPDGTVNWENGQAVVHTSLGVLTAKPGNTYIALGTQRYAVPYGVRLENGVTLVPIRALAAALGGTVDWDPETGTVTVTGGNTEEDPIYWLSHIISAESQGEPMEGKIAVGNVVLNRVAHPDFPDTIYGVIFDSRWGGQFEPVRNGTIYNAPTEESIQAAVLCLKGANTAEDSLYFLDPNQASNLWTVENKTLVTIIGVHWFYR